MANKPAIVTLTNSSVDVLNAIRNSATVNYRDYVPIATPDADSIKEIGAIIMNYPSLQNEFLSALVNRIGRVILTSKVYSNPWSMFKKGLLDFGESLEEIFTNLAKPFQYDPATAENKIFAREIPDVRAAFYIRNYQKYYKSTIQNDSLRAAFMSWDGITSLIASIVNSMYTAANYDEFQTMKYMLARKIINGEMYSVSVPELTKANAADIVTEIKAVSNNFEFESDEYNLAHVYNHSLKDSQYLILSSKADSIINVNVLATAFNMEKAEFMGHVVLIDGFGKLDIARLNTLFADDPTYEEIGEDELEALNEIPAVLVDRDYFMIFDNLVNFTENYNGEGLYWNYWYHVWKTFAVSPFANNAMFIPATPGVTSVTVNPSTITIAAGASAQLTATVVTTNFAPQTVVWTSDNEHVSVNASGVITSDGTGTQTANIKATSVYDSTKSGTCVVTVSA